MEASLPATPSSCIIKGFSVVQTVALTDSVGMQMLNSVGMQKLSSVISSNHWLYTGTPLYHKCTIGLTINLSFFLQQAFFYILSPCVALGLERSMHHSSLFYHANSHRSVNNSVQLVEYVTVCIYWCMHSCSSEPSMQIHQIAFQSLWQLWSIATYVLWCKLVYVGAH